MWLDSWGAAKPRFIPTFPPEPEKIKPKLLGTKVDVHTCTVAHWTWSLAKVSIHLEKSASAKGFPGMGLTGLKPKFITTLDQKFQKGP